MDAAMTVCLFSNPGLLLHMLPDLQSTSSRLKIFKGLLSRETTHLSNYSISGLNNYDFNESADRLKKFTENCPASHYFVEICRKRDTFNSVCAVF